MKTRSSDEWIEELRAEGVPSGPINNLEQLFNIPQVKARQHLREVQQPLSSKAPTTSTPIRYSDTPVEYRQAPPLLGEHTEEVLAEFGLIDLYKKTMENEHDV